MIFIPYSGYCTQLQVGAFSDTENARDRAKKIKVWGYGVQYDTNSGGLIRVRTNDLVDVRLRELQSKLDEHDIAYYSTSSQITLKSNSSVSDSFRTIPEPNSLPELKKQLKTLSGTFYKWGGNSPDEGFDCSGLIHWLYKDFGIPRTVADIYNWSSEVESGQIKPGDLIFFQFKKQKKPDHIGIYIGDEIFYHASTNHGVTSEKLARDYYLKKFMDVRRPNKKSE